MKENKYWLDVISSYDQYNEPLSQILNREKLYQLVINDNIKLSAQKYFNTENILKAYLFPKNYKPNLNNEAKDIDGLGKNSDIIETIDSLDTISSDSVWTEYRIRPGYTLSLIAYEEYGNSNKWRTIYSWNKEKIGNNPNKIDPYHYLDLLKPRDAVLEIEPDYYIHRVNKGETLWTISRKEYGDEFAWIVLYWDNESLIQKNSGILSPGMELKVRTEIW